MMVNARLHLICGNCGNADKDLFVAEYDKGDDLTPPTIYIKCKDCGTIHNLEKNATIKPLGGDDVAKD